MEHLLYVQQQTTEKWDDFWHNYMSDNFEIPSPSNFLYKRNSYRELFLCPSLIYGQNESIYFSSHPALFEIRERDINTNDTFFALWMHDVMKAAPYFFCVATSSQYLAGLFSDLFEDYIQYGVHDFFARLDVFNLQFKEYLDTEFLNHSFFDTVIHDDEWEDFYPDSILDIAVDELEKSYQYQAYEAYPSADNWYKIHRHDVLVIATPEEIGLNI